MSTAPDLPGQLAAPPQTGGPLRLRLPPGLQPGDAVQAGRYFLVRCAQPAGDERLDWSIYLRRPLYVTGVHPGDGHDEWQLYLPAAPDPGYHWLARQAEGTVVNLLGPFGNGFTLSPQTGNLLVLADSNDDPGWLWLLLPLIEPMLDRSGRVTVLVRTEAPLPQAVLQRIPIAAEVQTCTTEAQWQEQLAAVAPWADQMCAGLPPRRYGELADAIRGARFRLEAGFAQVLVRADLLCGVGACLACVTPTARGGVTRACVHGPVFDLTRLVG